MKKEKAYKVFNSDFKCRDFQYEVGKTYTHVGIIQLCGSGFHSCKKINHCFNYYSFSSENKVCEVELMGDIIHGDDKSVCSKIKIIKEFKWSDVLLLANTGANNSGHWNSGHWNSGHSNSGDSNSGDSNSGHSNSGDSNSGDWNSGHGNSGHSNSGAWNSGHWNSGDSNSGDSNSGDSNSGHSNSGDSNSGDWNSGHWNSGHWNSGHFNTKTPDEILVFDTKCNKIEWDNIEKPLFINELFINEWIYFSNMNEEDKKNYPKAYVSNGYLKRYTYKESWKNAYNRASKKDIKLLKALPNFNIDKFEIITGIKL